LIERRDDQDEALRQKTEFERCLTVYREEARLLGSGLLGQLPGGDFVEQIAGLSLAGKLAALERRIRNRERRR
jgi:hypothetical protein